MKKTLFALVAVFAALTAFQPESVHAQQQEGFYVGGFGGANFLQTKKKQEFEYKFRTGYAIGGFAGYKWCQGFRAEGEVSYRHNRLKSIELLETDICMHGNFSSWSFMANGLYDLNLGCWDSCYGAIIPYIGGGIGYSHQKLKINSHGLHASGTENGFAWQIIAGLGYEISPCTDIDVEYRFLKGHAKHFYNHVVALTAKYHF